MSNIEWTTKTWNPTRGCDKVSPGCKHCYADTLASRFEGVSGHPYELGFKPRVVPHKLWEPLKWQTPCKVFVNSMSDLFHESFPFEYIAAVFGIMAACHKHTFQVLTKRQDRMADFFPWLSGQQGGARLNVVWQALAHEVAHHPEGDGGPLHMKRCAEPDGPWPLPNVWLGVSAEDQVRWDERVPVLVHRVPAAVRFVSAEPLLNAIDMRATGRMHLDWVIVGGESGPRSRPCNIDHVRSLAQQCADAGVACFVKQLGAKPEGLQLTHRKGGDMAEWPPDLRVRQFPGGAAC